MIDSHLYGWIRKYKKIMSIQENIKLDIYIILININLYFNKQNNSIKFVYKSIKPKKI